MTDTVGFIRKLPHQLVDAFGATLEETRLADLILHVVDASAPEEELIDMTTAVEDVLTEIGALDAPRVLVLAKADLIDSDRRAELERRHPDAVLISARTGEGVEPLIERVITEFAARLLDVELLLPYSEGEARRIARARRRSRTRGHAGRVRVNVHLPAASPPALRGSPQAAEPCEPAGQAARSAGEASDPRLQRRCRTQSVHARGGDPRAETRRRANRDRRRDPHRLGRPRAAPLRAGGQARHRARQGARSG